MISFLRGTLVEKFNGSVTLDVGGVGYEVTVPTPDFEQLTLGEEHQLFTHHSVRENAEDLYGFSSLVAKKLFELLISVQGIGPKAAIAILSLADSETVRNAIANADAAFVSKASGIGKKSAERIIVDLHDKVGIPSHYGTSSPLPAAPPDKPDEALDALIALGFPLKEATAALEKVDKSLSTAERVKLALKN